MRGITTRVLLQAVVVGVVGVLAIAAADAASRDGEFLPAVRYAPIDLVMEVRDVVGPLLTLVAVGLVCRCCGRSANSIALAIAVVSLVACTKALRFNYVGHEIVYRAFVRLGIPYQAMGYLVLGSLAILAVADPPTRPRASEMRGLVSCTAALVAFGAALYSRALARPGMEVRTLSALQAGPAIYALGACAALAMAGAGAMGIDRKRSWVAVRVAVLLGSLGLALVNLNQSFERWRMVCDHTW